MTLDEAFRRLGVPGTPGRPDDLAIQVVLAIAATIARRAGAPPQEVDDVAAVAAIKVLEQGASGDLREVRSPRAWLAVIVRNLVTDAWRRRRRERETSEGDAPEPEREGPLSIHESVTEAEAMALVGVLLEEALRGARPDFAARRREYARQAVERRWHDLTWEDLADRQEPVLPVGSAARRRWVNKVSHGARGVVGLLQQAVLRSEELDDEELDEALEVIAELIRRRTSSSDPEEET